MEENDVRHLSTDELRTQSEELRAQFAEKQKVLLEVKSKINRGKLSSVNNATERTLSAFLRSCCEETEKEQSYVSEVIDRVRTTADHARANLERVNEHAHDLLRNVDNDVLELQDNLQRVHSGYAQLSTVLEQRALKGGQLRQREEHIGMSSLTQMERAEKVFSRIGVHFDSQISRLESVLAQRTQEDCCAQQEQVDLEREAEKAETVLTTFNDEDQALTNQLQKAENEFDHLQTQLTSRNKAKECAESDQVRIEMEVSELREAAESMFESISSKRITIEENEEKITQLSDELLEVNEIIISTENELKLFEESLFMLHDTAKKESEELMHTLELELEDVSTQLSTGIIRADLMDQMFGNDLKLSSQDWINLIEKSRSEKSSNQMVSDARAILLVSLDNVKAELENVRQEAKTELGEYNMAQSRVRNLKRRVEEDRESRQTNIRMAEARLAQAKKELEELTNAKCNDSCAVLVTPNPARHSSLQNQKIACVGVSRGLSDDSDVESVKKSVINLPDGIVKRNAATQQCSTLRSPDDSQNDPLEDGAVDGGVSTETTVATNPDGDGDVTMEGIPLSVSVDHAVLDDRIGTWVRETPSDNNSPASGSTGEMMENRFPENIFNETNALNETDITMDMEDNDLNMSLMEMPPTMTIKTVSPPPVRHASSKSSIFVNDSDSDANASVWDDEF
ncbi:hypothetical protein PFISCL1PPCAC_2103 [Pristionchus fissidentatus]|uniref:Uncharacterized protein n=1 Tax=Pristionchus fissidentatus TaxID=1538716 RepID=A0AAV5UWB6_9BILA|nr:hypothetical protein PFISCL1PPCAC_2103 [Pristionchus fissidentatus]